MNKFIIAIDGPAASGKGTVTKLLAKQFNIKYLPTGNMYRALAKKIIEKNLENNINDNQKQILELANKIQLSDLYDDQLGNEKFGETASKIASLPLIRNAMYDFQRNFAITNEQAILEGRDIGTVIYPEANLKIFITADLETRAKRRFKELQLKGIRVIYEQILEDMKNRDIRDKNRIFAPLKPANDAIIIDTSMMSIDQVINQIISIIEKKYRNNFFINSS